MKRFISTLIALTITATSLSFTTAASAAAPADYAAWPTCITAADQYCVESATIALPTKTAEPLANQGLTVDAHFFDAGLTKALAIELQRNFSQDLGASVVGATVNFTIRTATWKPSKQLFGQGEFVSYSTSASGENNALSISAKIIRHESNTTCTPEACDGAAEQAYAGYFQVVVMNSSLYTTDETLLSTAGTSQMSGWNKADASFKIQLSQPKTLPLKLDAVLSAANIAKALGASPSYVAANFKIALSQNKVAIGSATMQATSAGLQVRATAEVGGAFTVTISPKVLLAKPVISTVKYISKTKQTVIVKPNKTAKSLYVTCYGAQNKEVTFSSTAFTFTKTMPKGDWSCTVQLVNGYRGPNSFYFGLYNRG